MDSLSLSHYKHSQISSLSTYTYRYVYRYLPTYIVVEEKSLTTATSYIFLKHFFNLTSIANTPSLSRSLNQLFSLSFSFFLSLSLYVTKHVQSFKFKVSDTARLDRFSIQKSQVVVGTSEFLSLARKRPSFLLIGIILISHHRATSRSCN